MDEYIKRDVFMKGIMEAKWMDGYDGAMAMEIAASAPAADVVPVIHGRWIPISDGAWAECSECGEGFDVNDNGGMTAFNLFREFYKYCPHCGAKMGGGADNG